MPHYDYLCELGHRFEVFQAIHDPRLERCPEHPQASVRREIGAGLRPLFRGTGFYETDYKAKPNPDNA